MAWRFLAASSRDTSGPATRTEPERICWTWYLDLLASGMGGLGMSAAWAAATRRKPKPRAASRGEVMGRSRERKGRGGPTRITAGRGRSLAPMVALYGEGTRRRGPN